MVTIIESKFEKGSLKRSTKIGIPVIEIPGEMVDAN
jgi:hypothetical protein